MIHPAPRSSPLRARWRASPDRPRVGSGLDRTRVSGDDDLSRTTSRARAGGTAVCRPVGDFTTARSSHLAMHLWLPGAALCPRMHAWCARLSRLCLTYPYVPPRLLEPETRGPRILPASAETTLDSVRHGPARVLCQTDTSDVSRLSCVSGVVIRGSRTVGTAVRNCPRQSWSRTDSREYRPRPVWTST